MKRQAMTLFEVMLSLALSAVLMAVVFASVEMCWQYDEKGRSLARESQSARALVQMIQRDLMNSSGPPRGMAHEIMIPSRVHRPNQYVASGLIIYSMRTGNGEDLTPAAYRCVKQDQQEDWELLTRNVADLQFAYSDGSTWEDVWESLRMPRAIRITVSDRSDAPISLIVAFPYHQGEAP